MVRARREVVAELKAAGATWIEFDEPTLVLDLDANQLQAFTQAHSELVILIWFECSDWDILCWCYSWAIQDTHLFEGCYWLWVWPGSWSKYPWFDLGWIPFWKKTLCRSSWWKEYMGQWSCIFTWYPAGSWGHCWKRFIDKCILLCEGCIQLTGSNAI